MVVEGHHIEEAVVDMLQAEVAVDTLLIHTGFYLMDLQNKRLSKELIDLNINKVCGLRGTKY